MESIDPHLDFIDFGSRLGKDKAHKIKIQMEFLTVLIQIQMMTYGKAKEIFFYINIFCLPGNGRN